MCSLEHTSQGLGFLGVGFDQASESPCFVHEGVAASGLMGLLIAAGFLTGCSSVFCDCSAATTSATETAVIMGSFAALDPKLEGFALQSLSSRLRAFGRLHGSELAGIGILSPAPPSTLIVTLIGPYSIPYNKTLALTLLVALRGILEGLRRGLLPKLLASNGVLMNRADASVLGLTV